MSRNGECRFSIPRVYFVLQSRYGDKEDRRIECIFVEWRVFIDDMLPPSLSLSHLFSRSVVSCRLHRAKCNGKFRRTEKIRVARERSTYFRENPQNISALAVSRRETSAPYKAQQLRKSDVKIFSMSDTFSSFFFTI